MEKKRKKKSKKEEKWEKYKKIISSYQFLYTTFGILLVLVLILGLLVYDKGKSKKDNIANMVVPIIETGTHNSLRVDLSSLKGQEYLIKIKNNREKKVNEEEISYLIRLSSDYNSEIEVTKNNETENILTDDKISDSLKAKKKEEITYHIKLKETAKVKAGDQLLIEIES